MSEPRTPATHSQTTTPADAAFECARITGLGGVTLEVRGRLDADAADRLQEALRDVLRDARLVVLDLQALEAIDSAGVYVIAQANRAAKAEGRRLVIVRPPSHVDAAFELEGDGGLTVVDTSAAARLDPHSLGGLELDIRPSATSDAPHFLIACRGEIDAATAPQLRDAIAGLDLGDVIVDLNGTAFMDSTGLSTLLNASRRLTRRGRRLVVVCPHGTVWDLIRLTALLETLNVVDDQPAAQRKLSR